MKSILILLICTILLIGCESEQNLDIRYFYPIEGGEVILSSGEHKDLTLVVPFAVASTTLSIDRVMKNDPEPPKETIKIEWLNDEKTKFRVTNTGSANECEFNIHIIKYGQDMQIRKFVVRVIFTQRTT